MRLKIRHETVYRFETPAAAVTQTLRVTPRNHEGQHVIRWRVDIDRNCRLRSAEDAFGNQTHVFSVEGPVDDMTVLVEGEIDTQDTSGVVAGAVERFPPALYLRETELTGFDLDIAAFAQAVREDASDDPLSQLHALLGALHREMTFDPKPAESATTAAEAFRLKRGLCQDLAHVFIVAARAIGVPARYVSGYLLATGDMPEHEAGHAWVEAHVPGLGWVGFDPAHRLCATEAHARVAIGLDSLGAAPIRGVRYGGAAETFDIKVKVEDVSKGRGYRRF
ncbi:transglutaminase domain-containing protein [Methylopila henanensis]|uniref:Transglutaminase domain-containing protein n=1 Tax=Methylopila henanensis TaxID=873516 RepID=A0ABW4K0K3_9HYPH